MTFTDDDLKRFKTGWSEPFSKYAVDKEVLQALLARLEAAEKAILAMLELDDFIALGTSDMEGHNKMVDKTRAAIDRWRKAAGK